MGLASLGATVKALGTYYPLGEVIFFRCMASFFPVLIIAYFDPLGFRVLKTRRFGAHARRAIAGATGLATSFGALLLLPYADATALSFSAPLVIVAIAGPLLGERIGPYRLGAVLFGFIGVLLIVYPHATIGLTDPKSLYGVGLGILSAFGVAWAQISVRALREEPAITTVFYLSVCLTFVSLLTLPFGWHWPRNLNEFMLLCAVGLIGGLAQIAVSQAYRVADASTLAPFDYLQLIWAVAIGYFLFDEVPLPMVLLGALIVVGSGLLITLRERTLKQRGQPVEDHTAQPTL